MQLKERYKTSPVFLLGTLSYIVHSICIRLLYIIVSQNSSAFFPFGLHSQPTHPLLLQVESRHRHGPPAGVDVALKELFLAVEDFFNFFCRDTEGQLFSFLRHASHIPLPCKRAFLIPVSIDFKERISRF